eukprot:429741-Pyramimonas_sp.AAC.1
MSSRGAPQDRPSWGPGTPEHEDHTIRAPATSDNVKGIDRLGAGCPQRCTLHPQKGSVRDSRYRHA